jgi:hypothetical protein
MKITLSYAPHISAFIAVDTESKKNMGDLLFFPLEKDGMDCYSHEQIIILIKALEEGEVVEFIK